MTSVFGKIVDSLYDLIFPRVCMACLEEAAPQKGSLFCVKCMFEIPYTDHFENANNDLLKHFYGRLDLGYAAALMNFTEGGLVQNILHNFKYKGMIDIGNQLGQVAGDKVFKCGFFSLLDVVIPVPLHDDKKFIRGFNQSEIFGKAAAYQMNLPIYTDVLLRSRFTETQTKKSRAERKNNVEDAFIIKKENLIEGKHILLVDDVITTGATIQSCAKSLNDAGAGKISLLSIAKALR